MGDFEPVTSSFLTVVENQCNTMQITSFSSF